MIAENTDYHCHILPAVDDGAYNLKDAVAMARKARAIGFKKLMATPHFEINYYVNSRKKILHKVRELNDTLGKAGIDIIILPGSEIMLDPGIPKLLKEGQLMTIGNQGTHVLVELPFNNRPPWFEEVICQIQVLGITPVLAHPERYEWLPGDKNDYMAMRNFGLEFQCNLGSLAGKYGQVVRKKVETIKSLDIVEYWGSDAHSLRGYEILGSYNK